MTDVRHLDLGFLKIRILNCAQFDGQYPSSCKISRRFVKLLLRYHNFLTFFKMAAVGHLGFVVWVFAALINSIWRFITVQNIVGIDEALSII